MNRYLKPMIKLSWPIMAGMILQSMLGSVDLYFVARLGTASTAALAIGSNVFIVINALSAVVSTGVLAIVARRKGEGNLDEVRRLTLSGAKSAFVLGTLLLVLGYGSLERSIELMFNAGNETSQLIFEYLQVIMLFVPVVFTNSSLRSALHAVGDTRSPLLVFGLSNIINMVLDPIFIFSLRLGIRGAALATGLSIVIAAILIARTAVFKPYCGKMKLLLEEFFKWDYGRTRSILKIGIWDALQRVARPLTAIMMFRIVYQAGGDSASAAFGIGGQFIGYTFVFLTGLTVAISVMIGQKLGEGSLGEVDEIIRFSFKLAVVNMVVFAFPYLLFPKQMMNIFTQETAVVSQGVAYLRIVYVGLLFVVIPIVYGGALKGGGYTYGPMVASIVANVFVKIGLAVVLSSYFDLGAEGVWWAIAISVVAEAWIIMLMERRKDWKSIKI